MTNGEMIQKVFNCEVCEPIPEDDIIHVIFPDKNDSAIGFDWSWWNMEYKDLTTKNDLGVDCVARQDVERYIEGFINEYTPEEELEFINLELDGLKHIPSVTPQEPFKPMVEIDLYSVIKQKYIEREVLDKIRAEIAEYGSIMVAYAITKETKTDKGIEKLVSDVLKQAKEQVLDIIDKYKAEVEPQESEGNMKSLSQNIIEHAKRLYPKALSYKGNLTDVQFYEIEKQCDIDFYKLASQDIRYTIRYKAESEK